MTASGGVVEFPVPRCGNDNGLWGLTTGPDGDLWFTTTTTQPSQACFGKVTTSGQVTLYTPTVTADLRTIVCGPDGDLYATDTAGSGLVRITPSGVETRFATLLTSPYGLGVGPDDQIWMTGMSGQVEEFDPATNVMSPVATMPSQRGAQPSGFTGITIGPDRDMWFTSGDSGEGVAQYVGLYEKR